MTSPQLSAAINACGNARWPTALHLFANLKEFDLVFSSYEGIAKALSVNWAMSLQVLSFVPDFLADVALYRQALLSCCKSGELMQALRLQLAMPSNIHQHIFGILLYFAQSYMIRENG